MNLIELQNKIHAQNVEMGWWDEPRSFSAITNLGISENSEAMEGDRRDLPDDHLPQYPMVVVELCDMCVRTFDFLGSVDNTKFTGMLGHWKPNDFHYNLASTTYYLAEAWKWMVIDKCEDSAFACLRIAISQAMHIIKNLGYDPIEIILEKVEYNKHRADHKRENRALSGGKKY